MTMSKGTKAKLAQVQEEIDRVVSDRSVSREELREFLEEIECHVEGIQEGLNADEMAGR
jgi:hypothetical protein